MTARSLDVVYRVVVRSAQQEIDVQMTITGVGATVDLASPSWVPGDYEFRGIGRDVFDLTASDPRTGTRLPAQRRGWQGYTVETSSDVVTIDYVAYCGASDLSESCGIVRDDVGIILGPRLLMVEGHDGACTVTYEVPSAWPIHHPSGADHVGPRTWRYPSYELLVDTPVTFGHVHRLRRTVEGTDFHFLFLERPVGDDEQLAGFVDDVALVAHEYHRLFGSFPFDDYTFILSANPADDWGLEHLTSTMVGLNPTVLTDAGSRATGIRACAHELFHAWNVRRLRPAPLGDVDFVHGSFTDGLWMAEGFTRYYEFLTCTRTGIYTADEFLSNVVNYHRQLSAAPSSRRVAAADSSYSAFLTHNAYPGDINSSYDYYAKGMLLAFGLDVSLRLDGTSLDEALVSFYHLYAGVGSGYTTEMVGHHFDAIRPGLGTQLVDSVVHPAEIDLGARLGSIGFELVRPSRPRLGLVLQDGRGPAVADVIDDSPAGSAGLSPLDVIIGVNGHPFSVETLRACRDHDATVDLAVTRGTRLLDIRLDVSPYPTPTELRWTGDATDAARICDWLRRPFDATAGRAIPLSFYENFHPTELVV